MFIWEMGGQTPKRAKSKQTNKAHIEPSNTKEGTWKAELYCKRNRRLEALGVDSRGCKTVTLDTSMPVWKQTLKKDGGKADA